MSDELLRHIADHPALLSKLRVFDPETKKYERVWTGQSSRLLLKMCSHANQDRLVYVGRGELMEKTDLNGQSIETFERRFSLVGILAYIGKKSYRGSAPVKCYLIDLPELPPLEDVLTDAEIKQRARKAQNLKNASKDALTPALGDVLEDALAPALNHDLPVRHKQKQEPELQLELQLQLEQVFDIYADFKRKSYTGDIRNEKTWREGVKKNALKLISPRGLTFKDLAIDLLKQGYRPKDIAAHLADGCVNGQSIIFWDKRPGFLDAAIATELAPINFGQTVNDSEVPF